MKLGFRIRILDFQFEWTMFGLWVNSVQFMSEQYSVCKWTIFSLWVNNVSVCEWTIFSLLMNNVLFVSEQSSTCEWTMFSCEWLIFSLLVNNVLLVSEHYSTCEWTMFSLWVNVQLGLEEEVNNTYLLNSVESHKSKGLESGQQHWEARIALPKAPLIEQNYHVS